MKLFSKDHEWVDDDRRVGITNFAVDALGDVVFIGFLAVGTAVKAGDSVAVIESVKAASDVYTPLSGTIIEVNEEVANDPSIVNRDPMEAGWLFKLEVTDDADETSKLMNAEDYQKYLDNLEH